MRGPSPCADHVPKLSQAERQLKAKIADVFRAAGLSPPGPDDLAAKAGPRAAVIPDLLTLLRRRGTSGRDRPPTVSRL